MFQYLTTERKHKKHKSIYALHGWEVTLVFPHLYFSTVLSGWVGGDDAVSAAVLFRVQQHGGATVWRPGCSLQSSLWPGQVCARVYRALFGRQHVEAAASTHVSIKVTAFWHHFIMLFWFQFMKLFDPEMYIDPLSQALVQDDASWSPLVTTYIIWV